MAGMLAATLTTPALAASHETRAYPTINDKTDAPMNRAVPPSGIVPVPERDDWLYLDCPPSISPDDPIVRHTHRGALFAQPTAVKVRGQWFEVPQGYLQSWSLPDELRQRVGDPGAFDAPFLDFAFWMPTLRWPERQQINTPSYRPCEAGRPVPGLGEYIVRAIVQWPWLPNPEGKLYQRPDDTLANRIEWQRQRLDTAVEEHGLLRLGGDRAAFDFYHSPPGIVPRLSLRCNPKTGRQPPNPSCNGTAWWPDENLGIRLVFARIDLPDWRAIADSARALAYQWRRDPDG